MSVNLHPRVYCLFVQALLWTLYFSYKSVCLRFYVSQELPVLPWCFGLHSVLRSGHVCRCWDDTENVAIWWIIKAPITTSLFVRTCTLELLLSYSCAYMSRAHVPTDLMTLFWGMIHFEGQFHHLHQRDPHPAAEAEIPGGRQERCWPFHVSPPVPRSWTSVFHIHPQMHCDVVGPAA